MPKNEQVKMIISEVIDEKNEELSDNEQIGKSADTVLFGQDGALDSIELVNFIVAVEQKIKEVFEISISIADEKAVSQKNSPFRTIGALVDYVTSLLESHPRGE